MKNETTCTIVHVLYNNNKTIRIIINSSNNAIVIKTAIPAIVLFHATCRINGNKMIAMVTPVVIKSYYSVLNRDKAIVMKIKIKPVNSKIVNSSNNGKNKNKL